MEDQFRRLLGADQDADISQIDLDLVENPEPSGELLQVETKTRLPPPRRTARRSKPYASRWP